MDNLRNALNRTAVHYTVSGASFDFWCIFLWKKFPYSMLFGNIYIYIYISLTTMKKNAVHVVRGESENVDIFIILCYARGRFIILPLLFAAEKLNGRRDTL